MSSHAKALGQKIASVCFRIRGKPVCLTKRELGESHSEVKEVTGPCRAWSAIIKMSVPIQQCRSSYLTV